MSDFVFDQRLYNLTNGLVVHWLFFLQIPQQSLVHLYFQKLHSLYPRFCISFDLMGIKPWIKK